VHIQISSIYFYGPIIKYAANQSSLEIANQISNFAT